MKKWLLVVFALAACRSSGSAPAVNAPLTGAPSPRRAVELFMNAVMAQDLQAMSVVWGTAKGPARDQLERTELEKREIIMQTCYTHDKFRVLEEQAGAGGTRMIRVEITRGPRMKTPNFATVQGPGERWYVLDADIQSMRELCGNQ